jgi:hypothetical protein
MIKSLKPRVCAIWNLLTNWKPDLLYITSTTPGPIRAVFVIWKDEIRWAGKEGGKEISIEDVKILRSFLENWEKENVKD